MIIKSLLLSKVGTSLAKRNDMKRIFISLNIFALILLLLYVMISVAVFMNNVSVPTIAVNTVPDKYDSVLNAIDAEIQTLDLYLDGLTLRSQHLTKNSSQLIFPAEVQDMTRTAAIAKGWCTPRLGADLQVLVMVLNRVDDFQRRATLRHTWAQDFQSPNRSKLYFAVGLSRDETVQRRLVAEDLMHHDIIQWSYYESYYNCSIKSLAILRWTATNCPLVKYVLKADDDSLIRSDKLIDFVRQTPGADTIYGHMWTKPGVFRTGNKWSINTSDYTDDYYPDYIGGPWLIPGPKVMVLYSTAILKSLPALPFEDAYITGIVASKANVNRESMPGIMYLDYRSNCDIERLDLCWYDRYSIFWQGINDSSMTLFYNRITRFDAKSCTKFSFHYLYNVFDYYFNLIFNGYKTCVLV